MKRLFIVLFLCVFFSPGAEAGKVTLYSKPLGELDITLPAGEAVCEYTCTTSVYAYGSARAGMTLHLRLIAGEESISLWSKTFTTTGNYGGNGQCPSFVVPGGGTEWILAWSLENSRGRVITALELATGTCQ